MPHKSVHSQLIPSDYDHDGCSNLCTYLEFLLSSRDDSGIRFKNNVNALLLTIVYLHNCSKTENTFSSLYQTNKTRYVVSETVHNISVTRIYITLM